jgi:GNAT superfamily N-acetyltransferase
MRLTLADLDALFDFVGIAEERRPTVREKFETGERSLENTRIAKNDAGAIVTKVSVMVHEDGVGRLYPQGEPDADLVAEAVARGRELGAEEFGGYIPPEHRDAFVAAGFHDFGERIEFKAPLDELPDEAGTPLQWRVAGEDEARMLAAVAEGDPFGHDEREDPQRIMRAWRSDPMLRDEADCAHVGSLDGEDVAFVMAQANREGKGWCRISYMGLVPSARGRGLGRWVHRHGFSMMRAQGGKEYHGGTATANAAMLALFRAHGCRETRRIHNVELRKA